MNKKILVAYFSCSGVTRKAAESIAQATGGDLYEIEPQEAYTSADLNWRDNNSRSTVEMKNLKFRPPIKSNVDNMDAYDAVFVGFPIWWYIAPTIINTFLESYDFSGKAIIPFATSGGSGLGKTEENLYISCSNKAIWKPAKLLGFNMHKSELAEWIGSLNL